MGPVCLTTRGKNAASPALAPGLPLPQSKTRLKVDCKLNRNLASIVRLPEAPRFRAVLFAPKYV